MTREEVLREMDEVHKDLLAFKMARSVLHDRIRDMEGDLKRQETLTDWPGFKVVDNGLIMTIVRCEGLLEDYSNYLNQLEVPDNVVKMERA
jgi:hypothetical protein